MNKEDYYNIIDNISDSIYHINTDGIFILVNKALTDRFGIEREKFYTLHFLDVVDPRYHEVAKKNFERVMGGEDGFSHELGYEDANGQVKFVDVHASPIHEGERVVGLRGISRDITARKQAEKALQQSEEKYRLIVDNAREAIVITQDLRLVFVNRAAIDITGYTEKILTSTPITEFIHADDRDMVMENHIKRLKGEEAPSIYSYRVVRRDGSIIWAETNSITVEWNERPAVLNFLSDITERKQAEKALEEGELRFRLAAESCADLIWEWDIITGELKWFGPIDKLLGYGVGEFPRTIDAWEDMIHEDDYDRVMAKLDRHFEDGTPYFEEYRVLRKDGATLYWSDRGTAVRYTEMKPSKMVGAVTNVTELKLAEERLKTSEEQFRYLMESIPVGILTIEGTRFGYVNAAFEKITGYSRDELRQIDVWDIIHPEFKDDVRQYLQKQHKRVPVPEIFALKIMTKSGKERWIERRAIPIVVRERPLVLLTVEDITGRKESEEKLKAREIWFRSFVEAIPIGIFSYEKTKFRYVNPSFEKISGYSFDELRLLDVWDIVHPDFKDGIREYVHKRQRGEPVPERLELKIVTKSGEERWLERAAIPIELGEISSVLIAAIDITEDKQVKDTLENLVSKRTTELSEKNERLLMEIKERERVEASLRKRRDELKLRAGELKELNSALKVLLKQRDEDKRELEERVMANIRELVLPYIEGLKKCRLDARSKVQMSVLEANLNNITSSFTHRLSSEYSGFTPREIQVASLIRQGKSTKEMAEYMRVSTSAINLYRNKVRRKLGIISKKINLRSHLMSLS